MYKSVLPYGLVIAFLLGTVSWAEARADKEGKASNKEKIIGTWEMVKATSDEFQALTITFTKEGKLKLKGKRKNQEVNIGGTYEVVGDAIKTTVTDPNGNESSTTLMIQKLTDKEAIIKGNNGEVVEFKKKEKK